MTVKLRKGLYSCGSNRLMVFKYNSMISRGSYELKNPQPLWALHESDPTIDALAALLIPMELM